MGGAGGDRHGALWPQLRPAALSYTCTRTAAWLRTSHVWSGGTSVSNSTHSCDGHHSPVCTCTCAGPGGAASGTCSQQRGKPPQLASGGEGHCAVSTRGPPSLHGGRSGEIRGAVSWEEEGARVGPELCPTAAVGRAGPTGERSCPVSTPGKGAEFLRSPQNHGLSFSLPYPPRQHHKPRELQLQSTKQPGSGQLGRASGPGRTYYSSP